MGTSGAYSGQHPTDEQEQVESSLALSEVWIAVQNNRWLVALAFVLTVAATVAYTKTRTPLFSAQATIRMDPEAPQPLGDRIDHVADIEGDYWDRQEYYNTVFEMIQAKSTALVVVKNLSLHRNPGFIDGTKSDEVTPEQYVTAEQAAGVLKGRLSISAVKESRLALVSYTDANPARAARVLSGVLDAYMSVHQGELNEASDNAVAWLDDQLGSLKGRLDKSELALHEYKKEKKILSVSADDQSEILRAKMAQLTSALTSAEASRARIGARRAELRKIKGDDPSVLPARELTNSLVLKSLREKYMMAFERVASLEAEGKGPGHPQLASAAAARDAAKHLLLAEVANVKESVEKDYSAISDEIGSLNALYNAAKEQALELNLLAIEYKRLERSRNTNQELFNLVTTKSKETGLTSHLRPSNVRVVDHPEIPGAPFFPNVPLNLFGGAIGGLLLGLGLAFGREQLDSTIRRPEVVERVFGTPFLGILPAIKANKTKRGPTVTTRAELTVHHEPSGAMAEAARGVRTNVMLGRGVLENTKVLLTTSAAPGDGKTTVACSLAISLAQTGQKVALVDCDLRRPRIHRIFGKSNDAGVSSILAGSMTLEQVAQGTEVTNLTVVPSGHPPINPAELLHGENFAAMLRDLRANYDRVILDSPPLIPVADGTILATQADATLIVARAFETKKHTARRAARVLRDVDANTIGTVLNAVDFSRGEYRYYQYYDYGQPEAQHSNFPGTKS
jgi:capsular exopolysaccharide synthesis family protein